MTTWQTANSHDRTLQQDTRPYGLQAKNTKGTKLKFDVLSNRVIGCALEVHRTLGPGLLESTYEQCLARELSLAGVPFELQAPLPVEYKDFRLDCGYRIDLPVDRALIVELKSVDKLAPIHEAQLLTYLKLSRIRVGP
jgi:GxxExxY protein